MKLGDYDLQQRIAVGPLTELYRATVDSGVGLERTVALRCLRPEAAQDRETARKFTEGAKLAARLGHPNITEVLDLGFAEGRYYLAQEFVEGQDLAAIQLREAERGGSLPSAFATHIVMEVCQALHHVHGGHGPAGQGVVHGGIAPRKLMVSYDGEVKLLDFGLSDLWATHRRGGAALERERLAYMSPEQSRGEPLDARSDLYSLGICLYEMLTGRRLFLRAQDSDTLEAVRQAKVPPPRKFNPRMPRALETTVLRMLQADRSLRPPDAEDVYDELHAASLERGEQISRPELAYYMRELFESENS
jgi:serine/threonine protein kinase